MGEVNEGSNSQNKTILHLLKEVNYVGDDGLPQDTVAHGIGVAHGVSLHREKQMAPN